jgi:hypothetical protein
VEAVGLKWRNPHKHCGNVSDTAGQNSSKAGQISDDKAGDRVCERRNNKRFVLECKWLVYQDKFDMLHTKRTPCHWYACKYA